MVLERDALLTLRLLHLGPYQTQCIQSVTPNQEKLMCRSHRTTWADRRVSAGSVLLRAEYVPIRAARRCYQRSSFGSSLFVIYLE